MRLFLLILSVAALAAGCREPEWQRITRSEDCLLAALDVSSSENEVNALLDANVYRESSGQGKRFRPGVRSIVKRDIDGAPGYEICFKEGVSPEVKAELKESLRGSPIVVDVRDGVTGHPTESSGAARVP